MASIEKFASKLLKDPARLSEFLAAFEGPQEPPAALIWKDSAAQTNSPFQSLSSPQEFPNFIQIVDRKEKPGAHPLHDQGAYYILDPGSVWEGLVLHGLSETPQNILDLCAAPGGKSIFAWKLLQPKLLLSNEPVQGRVRILISNLKRMGIGPTRVLSQMADQLGHRLSEALDLVVVDAPCSGQSLLARGRSNPGAFHKSTISGNAKRQKRIIAEAGKLVRPGGYLAYMTCTFAREENEEIIEWLIKKFPEFFTVAVAALEKHQSEFSDLNCYRFWPSQGQWAGGFTCLLKKEGNTEGLQNFEDLPCAWKSDLN